MVPIIESVVLSGRTASGGLVTPSEQMLLEPIPLRDSVDGGEDAKTAVGFVASTDSAHEFTNDSTLQKRRLLLTFPSAHSRQRHPTSISFLASPSPSQQTAKHAISLLAPPCQPLRQQRAPVIHHVNHHPVPLVLHKNIDEFSAGHILGHFREDESRGAVRSLKVESHAHALRSVVRIVVFGVLDEVPASLAMTAVIPAVGFELAEPTSDLVVLSDERRGLVEYGVRAHLGGEELLPDVVRAHGREGEGSGPEGQAGAGDDLFPRSEDHFLGGGIAAAFSGRR
mmetsp:Transcript_33322/g.80596  ORF Transcript_33322/g.80596 Transcript_33322/m.80596 type:complete len:283 (+) Transcript_33322:248-1096(+)